MSAARTATRLVRLYPQSWRARYGEELETLIVDMSGERRVPWKIRAEVAGAGGRERLRAAGLGGDDSPEAQARGGAALVLWGWALFIVAGTMVQKTTEHWQDVLTGRHTSATVAFAALIAVAVATAALVIAGIAAALPAVGALVRDGGWPRIKRPIVAAAWMTGVFLAAMVGLLIWSHGLTAPARNGGDTLYSVGFVTWALLGAGTLVAWTYAATRTAAQLRLSASTLRLEARLATAVTTAMAVMATATAVWWVSVGTVSPTALTGTLGSGGSAFVLRLAVALALMLIAVGLGATGARRASRALPQLKA